MDWLVRESVKIKTLDSLFYAIWNIHWHYPISASATQAASVTKISALATQPSSVTNSVQLVGDKGSRQVFGNIQPAEILEYALSKIENYKLLDMANS